MALTGARMKRRVPRTIPLPDEAMDVLGSIRPDNRAPDAYVFMGDGPAVGSAALAGCQPAAPLRPTV